MRLVARTTLALLLAVAMVPASSLAAQGRTATNAIESERVVRAFVTALDQRSTSGVLALAESNMAWMTTGPDSIVRTMSRGKPALERNLAILFAEPPGVSMTVESVSVVGPWIAAHVRGEIKHQAGMDASMSLMVFEVRGGRIQRIWQYPARVSGSNMPSKPDTTTSKIR